MATFTVTVQETTIKRTTREIEANDWEEAEEIASSEYWSGSITEWDYEDEQLETNAEEDK